MVKGKVIKQHVGKNKIGQYPRIIASFLCLLNVEKYTGHAFRRTASTWMADSGVDVINLKRFGGWKSDATAQSYVAESKAIKRSLAEKIEGSEALDETIHATKRQTDAGMKPVLNLYFGNCTFNNCKVGSIDEEDDFKND